MWLSKFALLATNLAPVPPLAVVAIRACAVIPLPVECTINGLTFARAKLGPLRLAPKKMTSASSIAGSTAGAGVG